MTATDYIHPDWVSGWRWLYARRYRRRVDPSGPQLIYDAWWVGSPNGSPGMIVYDRRGKPWRITKKVMREQQEGLFGSGNYMTYVKVWAERAYDLDREQGLTQINNRIGVPP